MTKKRATAAEKRHMEAVASLGCVVCRIHLQCHSEAEIHHLRGHPWSGGGQRASNYDVIGLCPPHHRTGGYGVAYHAGAEEWERRYGTQGELLAITHEWMERAA